MQIKYLNKKNNKNVIVFFNGWGFDENSIKHLDFENFDVIVCYDYSTLSPIDIDFSSYENKYLIAWSFGVFISNYYFENFKNFNKIIAINGTQKPIDDNYGIPVLAYNLTLNNFNEKTCMKFVQKIGINFQLSRSIEALKQELYMVKNLEISNFLNFTKAIISKKDRIFPYKNQINFWTQQKVQIEEIESNHYPFGLYKAWSDLI